MNEIINQTSFLENSEKNIRIIEKQGILLLGELLFHESCSFLSLEIKRNVFFFQKSPLKIYLK